MNELKDQVCSSWFAPVGSASDYPLLSKWVIYGEVHVEQEKDPLPSATTSPKKTLLPFASSFSVIIMIIYLLMF